MIEKRRDTRGLAEHVIDLCWGMFGSALRDAISRRIQAADATSRESYPPRHTWVYSRSAHHRELFQRALVPEFIQDFYEGDATKLLHYTLIATCKNERDSVESWLQSVVAQTAFPSQLVICDAGSTDGTLDKIQSWCAHFNNHAPAEKLLRVAVVELPRCTIAAGRNHAAEFAVQPVLLCTDLGCTLTPHWAELMLIPFMHRPDTEVVCGWYAALCQSAMAEQYLKYLMPRLEDVNPDTFLPSARSLGLTRQAFRRAGGFPEFLTRAGEDSLFDYYLRWTSERWAFVPDAVVQWRTPKSLGALFRTTRGYAQGDAEGGKLFWSHYLWLLRSMGKLAIELAAVLLVLALFVLTDEWGLLFILGLLAVAVLQRVRVIVKPFQPARIGKKPIIQVLRDWLCLGSFCVSQSLGFMQGLAKRGDVERRRLSATRGTYIVCTTEPLEPAAELFDLIKEGWFVLNLSLRGVRKFDHPHYDLFFISSLDLEVLIGKYLRSASELMLMIDPRCDLPAELTNQLEALVRDGSSSEVRNSASSLFFCLGVLAC